MESSENSVSEQVPFIEEVIEGASVRFVYKSGDETVGSILVTLKSDENYNVSGFFVDPSKRAMGVGSNLIRSVNKFLEREKAKGVLVNMVQGDAGSIYESNGWKKTEYKSDGAYGGYEFVYDAREKKDVFPKVGYSYKGFFGKDGSRIECKVVYRGLENDTFFVFDGSSEYKARRCNDMFEEPEFEFSEVDRVV